MMLSRVASRCTYANVAATLALFLALGGVGYAATSLPANSVGSAQLQPDAVTGAKVKNGTLRSADFKKGQLKAGPIGKTGPAGERGLAGPTGATGAAGPAGANGTAVAYAMVKSDATFDATRSFNITAVARQTGFPTGIYCIYGDFAPKVAVATSEWAGTSNAHVESVQLTPLSNCPIGPGVPRASVIIRASDNTALANGSFFIIFN